MAASFWSLRPFGRVALVAALVCGLETQFPNLATAQPGGRNSPGPGRGSPGLGGPGPGMGGAGKSGPGMQSPAARGPGMAGPGAGGPGGPGMAGPGGLPPGAIPPGGIPPGVVPAGAAAGQAPRPPAAVAVPQAGNAPRSASNLPPFIPAWYAQHPDAWQHPKPYADWRSTPAPPMAVVNAFFGIGPENPALAPMTTAEWLPLGVFTTPPHAGSQPTSFQQIAVSKAGQVKGVMFDAATNTVQPISGLCDVLSHKITWSVGQVGSLGFETTLDEMLKQAPAVSVISSAGTQPGSLVLVPAP